MGHGVLVLTPAHVVAVQKGEFRHHPFTVGPPPRCETSPCTDRQILCEHLPCHKHTAHVASQHNPPFPPLCVAPVHRVEGEENHHTGLGATFHLACETEVERSEWVSALNIAIKRVPHVEVGGRCARLGCVRGKIRRLSACKLFNPNKHFNPPTSSLSNLTHSWEKEQLRASTTTTRSMTLPRMCTGGG